ncbi:13420_t:CDS:2, partial [Racocetra fulgida]
GGFDFITLTLMFSLSSMSLFGPVVRLSVLRTFRQAVFFSSISTLFDKYLEKSRLIAKDKLKRRGFPSTLSTTASGFDLRDLQLLRVTFQPTPFKSNVLPDVDDIGFPEEYILPNISEKELLNKKFEIEDFKEISDDQVQTFLIDLHEIVKNVHSDEGMEEAETDTLYIASEVYMTAKPEFVINKKNISMIVIEDKHIKSKNLIPTKCYGEAQLAAEMLACGNENMLRIASQTGAILDQTIFAVRAVSTYFTFYKTVIPKGYWKELGYGLPRKGSIIIKRWPEEMHPSGGLDIAEP